MILAFVEKLSRRKWNHITFSPIMKRRRYVASRKVKLQMEMKKWNLFFFYLQIPFSLRNHFTFIVLSLEFVYSWNREIIMIIENMKGHLIPCIFSYSREFHLRWENYIILVWKYRIYSIYVGPYIEFFLYLHIYLYFTAMVNSTKIKVNELKVNFYFFFFLRGKTCRVNIEML